MNFKNYFDKEFELRYFEMNEHGLATPTIILGLLEEAAADHSFSIDHSLFDLFKKNIGWVLVSGVFEMNRYPSYKEKITIRTWLSNYSSISGYRENIILDENLNVIGKAKGLWVFFDIERRRPLGIFKEIKQKWSFHKNQSITDNIKAKINPVDSADYTQHF
jgi:acyl-ACP thioesterase